MAALNTRCFVAAYQDYYLCPLPAVQMPKAALHTLLEPVWTGEQPLEPVYRPLEKKIDQAEHIADGFCYTVPLSAVDEEGKSIAWQEQRLIVHSLKQTATQQQTLDARLIKAEQDIAKFNLCGRRRKCLDEREIASKVSSIKWTVS